MDSVVCSFPEKQVFTTSVGVVPSKVGLPTPGKCSNPSISTKAPSKCQFGRTLFTVYVRKSSQTHFADARFAVQPLRATL